jgi:hypothetical protein
LGYDNITPSAEKVIKKYQSVMSKRIGSEILPISDVDTSGTLGKKYTEKYSFDNFESQMYGEFVLYVFTDIDI